MIGGPQDMGGRPSGRVRAEWDEPVFHAAWERRAFALTLAMVKPGGWTLDMVRSVRENRAPESYLALSYYEIWLAALTDMICARGLVGADEIDSGHSLRPAPERPVLRADEVGPGLRRGAPTQREPQTPARFGIGQKVRMRKVIPARHTRLPGYACGKTGVIEQLHGCHVFPDSSAEGAGEAPQWLYGVRFETRELFGDDADPDCSVSIDAWESYIEAAA